MISEKRKAQLKKWYEENKERKSITVKLWGLRNHEKRKQIGRDWYNNNKQYYQKYYMEHKIIYNTRSQNYAYMRKYHLTTEAKEVFLKHQKYKCKICKETIGMTSGHVDHDHKTGYMRGILCSKCNHGLGMFRDNIEYMECAIIYLKQGGAMSN